MDEVDRSCTHRSSDLGVCKTVNLLKARLIEGDAQREQKKSRVCHVVISRFLGAPKSCAFEKTLKMYGIDSTP